MTALLIRALLTFMRKAVIFALYSNYDSSTPRPLKDENSSRTLAGRPDVVFAGDFPAWFVKIVLDELLKLHSFAKC